MNTNANWDAYPIFCIASHLLIENPKLSNELDNCWADATALYNKFLDSKFNDTNRSELDCINEFLIDATTTHSTPNL